MLVLLSPSKTLDYETPPQTDTYTQPQLLDESETLIEILRGYDIEELRVVRDVSQDLATLNIERYDNFETPFTPENARQAILAFDGDVYRDFEFDAYDEEDFALLQDHVGNPSGL